MICMSLLTACPQLPLPGSELAGECHLIFKLSIRHTLACNAATAEIGNIEP